MATVYLEPDDEITSAIAKLRGLADGEAVLIVPPGSRIATSRINFKLLAREAHERRLNVAAVSDDPAVRALAISAGLPTYDTVAGAEQALANFREQDRQLAERLGREPGEPRDSGESPPWSSTPATDTMIMPSPLVEAPLIEGRAGVRSTETQVLPATSQPEARRRRGRRVPIAPLLVVGLLALLVAGVAYGAYVFLPTATITLVPSTSPLNLDSFTVIADPGTAVVDPVAGTLPAQTIDVPLHVSDTFDATGAQVHETRATGSVRFRSENTVDTVSVAQGTVVATADGIQFETTEPATVPKADFATSTPGTVDVHVRALHPGLSGNVAAGAITDEPGSLSAQLVSVRNPDATSGGQRVEDKLVTQEDYDDAVATLTNRLDAALTTALADPNSIPHGLTAYPQTASHDAPLADQPATDLVGTVAPNFALALDATGHVLAVNESLIDQIAATRLDAALGPGRQMIGDQPTVNHGPGEVSNDLISYEVNASALTYIPPDLTSLLSQVRGKTVTEARDILSTYGTVDILMWPDFIDRLPDQISRISLTVTPPTAGS
jgi:hypothetical protein